jgi:hypothetical protein
MAVDGRILQNSLLFSLLSGNLDAEAGLHPTASTTTQSYATGDFLKECEKPRIGGIRATVCSQRRHRYSRHVISAHFSLAPKSRFPETETARGRDSVRMPVTPKEVRACGAAETIRWRSEPRI